MTETQLAVIALVAVAAAAYTFKHPATGNEHVPRTTISGPARVIDADTIVVDSTKVRLKGVDAPELGNPLGEAARRKMVTIVGTHTLTCNLTGEKSYHRSVGYCTTDAGVDIGQAIVEQGAALACPRYDARYLPFEQPAALAAQGRAPYCVRRR